MSFAEKKKYGSMDAAFKAGKDNSIDNKSKLWWNSLTNTVKIETSRKVGLADTFRMWGQLKSWEKNGVIDYWLRS